MGLIRLDNAFIVLNEFVKIAENNLKEDKLLKIKNSYMKMQPIES